MRVHLKGKQSDAMVGIPASPGEILTILVSEEAQPGRHEE